MQLHCYIPRHRKISKVCPGCALFILDKGRFHLSLVLNIVRLVCCQSSGRKSGVSISTVTNCCIWRRFCLVLFAVVRHGTIIVMRWAIPSAERRTEQPIAACGAAEAAAGFTVFVRAQSCDQLITSLRCHAYRSCDLLCQAGFGVFNLWDIFLGEKSQMKTGDLNSLLKDGESCLSAFYEECIFQPNVRVLRICHPLLAATFARKQAFMSLSIQWVSIQRSKQLCLYPSVGLCPLKSTRYGS